MRRYAVIIGIILVLSIAAVGAIAIPHGQSVGRFQSDFYAQRHQLKESVATLAETESPDAFCDATAAMAQLVESLPDLHSRHEVLASKENVVRAAWRSLEVTAEDIEEHERGLGGEIVVLPLSSDTVMARLARSSSERFKNAHAAGVISELTRNLSEGVKRVQGCTDRIAAASTSEVLKPHLPDGFVFDAGIVARNKDLLSQTVRTGIESLWSIADATHRQQLERSERARAAKDIIGSTKDHLAWLASARRALTQLCELGGSSRHCRSTDQKFVAAVRRMRADIDVVGDVIAAQNRSHERMSVALKAADAANTSLSNLQRFAHSSEIASVHESWSAAATRVSEARNLLYVRTNNKRHRVIADNLLAKPRARVDEISRKIVAHRDFVYQSYLEARRQESTTAGSIARSTRRAADRLRRWVTDKAEQASQSRIGQELTLSVKALILGTKAFYDLMDPNADPMTWAYSYQGDVDQLMRETDEVMRMEGPSLTGKNTLIESLVDLSHAEAFEGEGGGRQ